MTKKQIKKIHRDYWIEKHCETLELLGLLSLAIVLSPMLYIVAVMLFCL